jgi:hypothetical protein
LGFVASFAGRFVAPFELPLPADRLPLAVVSIASMSPRAPRPAGTIEWSGRRVMDHDVDERASLTRGGGSDERIARWDGHWDGHWDELAAAVVLGSGVLRAVNEGGRANQHTTATLAKHPIAAIAAAGNRRPWLPVALMRAVAWEHRSCGAGPARVVRCCKRHVHGARYIRGRKHEVGEFALVAWNVDND